MTPTEQIRAFNAKYPPRPSLKESAKQLDLLATESERSVSSVSELSAADLEEAHRTAGELLKLRDAGAISVDPRDPEARFYARLLHMFGGEVCASRASE